MFCVGQSAAAGHVAPRTLFKSYDTRLCPETCGSKLQFRRLMGAGTAAPIDPSTPKFSPSCPPPFWRGQDVALFSLEVQSAGDVLPAEADRGLRCQRIFVKVAFGGFALARLGRSQIRLMRLEGCCSTIELHPQAHPTCKPRCKTSQLGSSYSTPLGAAMRAS